MLQPPRRSFLRCFVLLFVHLIVAHIVLAGRSHAVLRAETGAIMKSGPEVVLIVRVSPDAERETRLELTDMKRSTLFAGARKIRSPGPPVSDAYLVWSDGETSVEYRIGHDGILYAEDVAIELNGESRRMLLQEAERLRSRHYGEMIPWSEADKLIPRKARLTVIDLETGRSFDVQRRAGEKHADVQPLTKEDTSVMKQIYGGRWSWQRRAILVKTDHRMIAASMNGMPHGGDGIPDNAFPGHFCIHFLDSATHGSGRIDPQHQLMVRKAGGQLDALFRHASADQVVDLFFTALNMGEEEIVKRAFPHANHSQIPFFVKQMGKRTYEHRLDGDLPDHADLLSVDIPVQVRIRGEGTKTERARYVFHMKRASLIDPWKMDFISMVMPGGHANPGMRKGG